MLPQQYLRRIKLMDMTFLRFSFIISYFWFLGPYRESTQDKSCMILLQCHVFTDWAKAGMMDFNQRVRHRITISFRYYTKSKPIINSYRRRHPHHLSSKSSIGIMLCKCFNITFRPNHCCRVAATHLKRNREKQILTLVPARFVGLGWGIGFSVKGTPRFQRTTFIVT